MPFKRTLIITAMDVEYKAVEKALEAKAEKSHSILSETLQLKSAHFAHRDQTIDLIQSGIGGVNAAIAMSFALEAAWKRGQPIDAVVLTGVGGALDPKLELGDLVIATHVTQHDSVFRDDDSTVLMTPGELFLRIPDSDAAALSSPKMQTHPVLTQTLAGFFSTENQPYHLGPMVSGAEFAAGSKRKLWLAENHGSAKLVDMEAAAVAQICTKQGLPFAVAKTVADRVFADHSISHEYASFVDKASERAAILACKLLLAQ